MRIIGTGSAVPQTVVTAAEIDARLGRPAGWTLAASGVAFRHVMTQGSQVDLALAAARAALDDAGMGAGELDLIVSACGIGYQTLPSTAPLIQRGLGLADGAVATFDINSTCLSFLSALEVVAGLLASGRYARALIVSAEVASRALPWATQPEVAALFGDGAGAAVVGRGGGGGGGGAGGGPAGGAVSQLSLGL